jgi:hypothetical protein
MKPDAPAFHRGIRSKEADKPERRGVGIRAGGRGRAYSDRLVSENFTVRDAADGHKETPGT